MASRAPDQAFAKRFDPKIAAAADGAFDALVAQRGGTLKGIKDHELEELRRQARLAGRNQVLGDVKDLEWSYDKETGTFRRKPWAFIVVAILGVLGTVGGDWLYALAKPLIFGG